MGRRQRLPVGERAGATWIEDIGYLGREQKLPGERAEATWEEGRRYMGEGRRYMGRGQELPGEDRCFLGRECYLGREQQLRRTWGENISYLGVGGVPRGGRWSTWRMGVAYLGECGGVFGEWGGAPGGGRWSTWRWRMEYLEVGDGVPGGGRWSTQRGVPEGGGW